MKTLSTKLLPVVKRWVLSAVTVIFYALALPQLLDPTFDLVQIDAQ